MILNSLKFMKGAINKKIIEGNTILFISCIIIFFLGDILRKIAILLDFNFIRHSTASKVLGLILMSGFFIFYIKHYLSKRNLMILSYIIILVIVFFVAQFSLKDRISQPNNMIENIEYLVKFLYFPVIIVVFSPLKNNSYNIKKIIKIFEVTFLINLVVLLLGVVFEIEVLKTYMGSRNGYMGIYNRSGQASYFFILFMLHYYYNILKKKKRNDLVKFFLVAFCALLIGTKRIYVFLFILFLFYFFSQKAYKSAIFYKISFFVLVALIVFKTSLMAYFSNTIRIFIDIYSDKGLLSSLTSYRSDLITSLFSNYVEEKWTWINYIMGGPSFQGYKNISGTDFIDLFLFFGIIGVIIYTVLFKKIIDFKLNAFLKFFFAIIILLSFLSGAFLYDPWVNLLFYIIICDFSNSETKVISM